MQKYVARTPAQLGQILRATGIEAEFIQKDARAQVGLTQSTISVAEADASRTSIKTLYKLCSCCSWGWFRVKALGSVLAPRVEIRNFARDGLLR
jgi:DNA-binding XRE family transcriptional regulator